MAFHENPYKTVNFVGIIFLIITVFIFVTVVIIRLYPRTDIEKNINRYQKAVGTPFDNEQPPYDRIKKFLGGIFDKKEKMATIRVNETKPNTDKLPKKTNENQHEKHQNIHELKPEPKPKTKPKQPTYDEVIQKWQRSTNIGDTTKQSLYDATKLSYE